MPSIFVEMQSFGGLLKGLVRYYVWVGIDFIIVYGSSKSDKTELSRVDSYARPVPRGVEFPGFRVASTTKMG